MPVKRPVKQGRQREIPKQQCSKVDTGGRIWYWNIGCIRLNYDNFVNQLCKSLIF